MTDVTINAPEYCSGEEVLFTRPHATQKEKGTVVSSIVCGTKGQVPHPETVTIKVETTGEEVDIDAQTVERVE